MSEQALRKPPMHLYAGGELRLLGARGIDEHEWIDPATLSTGGMGASTFAALTDTPSRLYRARRQHRRRERSRGRA